MWSLSSDDLLGHGAALRHRASDEPGQQRSAHDGSTCEPGASRSVRCDRPAEEEADEPACEAACQPEEEHETDARLRCREDRADEERDGERADDGDEG